MPPGRRSASPVAGSRVTANLSTAKTAVVTVAMPATIASYGGPDAGRMPRCPTASAAKSANHTDGTAVAGGSSRTPCTSSVNADPGGHSRIDVRWLMLKNGRTQRE